MIYDIYDVNSILKEVALKAKTNINSLEISLKSFTTYIKKYNVYRLLNTSAGESIDDDLLFENKDYEFKQSYDFCVRYKPKDRLFDVIVNNEEVILHLKNGFIAPKDEIEINEFINTIDSIKVQKRVFLRHLNKQKEIIMQNLEDVKDKDKFITIYKCSNFIDKKGGVLEFFIKDVATGAKNIIALSENTKIARFIKQKDGNSGRDIFGKYIDVINTKIESPKYSNDFNIIDNDEYLEYFNNKSGFVSFFDNDFTFNEELNFKNIQNVDNYKFTGDINTNTKITIGTNGEFVDAIGSGVQILANKIIINGNIGANVKIISKDLELNGQSHKDSVILTKEAKIDILKGNLKGDKVTIESIENGVIECNILEVNQVNGGNLRAQNININELYYNSNIEFSSKCTINNLKGGNNKIIFTPQGNISLKKQINILKLDLDSKDAEQQTLNKKITGLIYKYNKFQSSANELREMIKKYKEQKKEAPSYMVENYNYFLEIVKLIKSLKLKNIDLDKNKNEIETKIKSLQKEVFQAEFICKEGWLKYNDVVFELIFPKVYSSKTIIKGIGRYYFDKESKKIIHQKIFVDEQQEIDNYGF